MRIAILADSGCQLPVGNDTEGVFIVPLNITMNGKSYLDQIDINSQEVFDKMKLDEDLMVQTSQPATGEIIKALEEIKKQGYDHVLAIVIATGLSSTDQGVRVACENCDISVTVVDSKGTAGNHKYLVNLAKDLLDQGKELDEVVQILESCVDDSGTYILVPNLKHLAKGGRITPTVAKLAGLLKIVPVMKLNYDLGGKIDNFGKVRTIKKANMTIINEFVDNLKLNNTDYIYTIEHVNEPVMAEEMRKVLASKIGDFEVTVRELPAVVGAHMGNGGIGYQYIRKYSK